MNRNNRLQYSILLFAIFLIFSFSMGCGTKTKDDNKTDNSTSNLQVKAKDGIGLGLTNSKTNVQFSEAKKAIFGKRVKSPVITSHNPNTNQHATQGALSNRKVVMTGTMEIQTIKFDRAVEGISKIVQQSGGYVENSSLSGNKAPNGNFVENRAANFILRIPNAKFQYIMSSMGSLGTIINKTTNGEDVTYQFFDNEARLKTLKVKEERILEILKKTKVMEDVLSAENELQNTIYEIENLTGTQKKLSNLVEFSTLTISVSEVYESIKLVKKPDTLGERISYSFKQSIQLLVDIFKGTLIVLVVVFPFAIVVLIILAILWYFLKHRKKS